MARHALVVGVTGIEGGALAERLVRNGWQLHGPGAASGASAGRRPSRCGGPARLEHGRHPRDLRHDLSGDRTPVRFPGSPEQYKAMTDVTNKRIRASQLEWAAQSDAADYPGQPTPLVEQIQDVAPVWEDIVRRFDLTPLGVERLAFRWHTDAELGRTIETFTDMSSSRRLELVEYQETRSTTCSNCSKPSGSPTEKDSN
jgi:hypothetical protein